MCASALIYVARGPWRSARGRISPWRGRRSSALSSGSRIWPRPRCCPSQWRSCLPIRSPPNVRRSVRTARALGERLVLLSNVLSIPDRPGRGDVFPGRHAGVAVSFVATPLDVAAPFRRLLCVPALACDRWRRRSHPGAAGHAWCVGSVSRWRAGSRFTWDARTRNFA